MFPGIPEAASRRTAPELEVLTDPITGTVEYPTARRREKGKQPNFIRAVVDVVSAGLSMDQLCLPVSGHLPRVCIGGPLRFFRRGFLMLPGLAAAVVRPGNSRRGCLPAIVAAFFCSSGSFHSTGAGRTVPEVGGGSGGDAASWLGSPSVLSVDVVEPDSQAVDEYIRRLVCSFNGTHDAAEGCVHCQWFFFF